MRGATDSSDIAVHKLIFISKYRDNSILRDEHQNHPEDVIDDLVAVKGAGEVGEEKIEGSHIWIWSPV